MRDAQRDRRRCTARVNSGTSTVPMATPTMPSGSSIRRLAKYSHDTADGDDDAMIAPATISSCGPELAIMPGHRLAEKAAHLRVERNPQRRRECCRRAQHQNQQLQQPGDADGARR